MPDIDGAEDSTECAGKPLLSLAVCGEVNADDPHTKMPMRLAFDPHLDCGQQSY